METIIVILIMLSLIVASNVICKFVPFLSIPLLQIFLGCLFGVMPYALHFRLDTEIFMILFVAPLLFMDAKHISNHELWKYRKQSSLLALGLVFVSILICGYLIFELIPAMTLAASFALAAVLSPTDAVSVKAISSRVKMSHRTTTIVEGESLLNDASGLVAFKFAIAAQLTGTFSLQDATLSFAYVAIGGIVVGMIISYIFVFGASRLHLWGVEDANVHTLIQIIMPFTVFMIAEELHLSGILAVVACGIVASLGRSVIITTHQAHVRFISEGAWSSLLFALNGFVFLFLGMEFVRIVQKQILNSSAALIRNIAYILIIYLLMVLIRFVWVFFFVHAEKTHQFKNSLILTLSGVRGAITLAACLSIPLTLDNGDLFPARDLILFIACGVIFFSLLVANIVLPIIAPVDSKKADAERAASKEAILSAITHIKHEMTEDNRQAAYSLISHYKKLLSDANVSKRIRNSASMKSCEMDLMRVGLDAEKEALDTFLEHKEVDADIATHLKKSICYFDNHLEISGFLWSLMLTGHLLLSRKRNLDSDQLLRAKMESTEMAIDAIKKIRTTSNREIAKRAIERLRSILDIYSKIYSGKAARDYEDKVKELEFKAKQAEKLKLQEMLDQGEIDHATLSKLRMNIELEEIALIGIDIESEEASEDDDLGKENL